MPRFDPHKPHSEVHGIVGVRYLQDGHTFNSSGEPAAGIEPNIPVNLPTTNKEKAEEWPSMRRMPDGSFVEASAPKLVTETFIPRTVEAPPPILGPDGLPAQKEAAPAHKDDMRTKENKMVKIQWEQYHEGEDFPGVAEAKRVLGIA